MPGDQPGVNPSHPTSAKDATYGVMWAMRGQPHDAVAGRWESIVGSVLQSPVKMTDGRDSPQIKPMHSRPIGLMALPKVIRSSRVGSLQTHRADGTWQAGFEPIATLGSNR